MELIKEIKNSYRSKLAGFATFSVWKYSTRVEVSCDKLTSVWYYGIDYSHKKFYGTGPRSVDEETRMKGKECCDVSNNIKPLFYFYI